MARPGPPFRPRRSAVRAARRAGAGLGRPRAETGYGDAGGGNLPASGIGIGIGGAAWSGRVGETRELRPRTFGLGKQQRLGMRVRFGGVLCELLFGPFASGPAWSCGRDEEALEVVPVRAGSSLGSWTRFWASSGLDQRNEGLVDLAVAGDLDGWPEARGGQRPSRLSCPLFPGSSGPPVVVRSRRCWDLRGLRFLSHGGGLGWALAWGGQ